MSQDNTSDKNHKATEQKLSIALSDGDGIGISHLLSAVSGTVLLLLSITLAPKYALYICNFIKFEFETFLTRDFTVRHLSSLLIPVFYFLIILSAIIIFTSLALQITSKHSTFRLKNLHPSLKRISPFHNFSRKYNYKSVKSGTITTSKIAILLLFTFMSMMSFLHHREEKNTHTTPFDLESIKFIIIYLQAITVVFLLGEFAGSIAAFLKRNMMSNEEVKQELKDDQGNPEIKGKLRRKAHEVAFLSLPDAVSRAAIVLVNPTHYAVALEWKQGSRDAPRCTAKGQDQLAFTIIDLAKLMKVPIYRDPTTTRDIYKKVEVGETIKIEHFSAVAACLKLFR